MYVLETILCETLDTYTHMFQDRTFGLTTLLYRFTYKHECNHMCTNKPATAQAKETLVSCPDPSPCSLLNSRMAEKDLGTRLET